MKMQAIQLENANSRPLFFEMQTIGRICIECLPGVMGMWIYRCMDMFEYKIILAVSTILFPSI